MVYFRVDAEKLGRSIRHDHIKNNLLKKPAYSTADVDDFLLGPLEDMAVLEGDVLSFDMIYDSFSWYILRSWENEEIQKYFTNARRERKGGSDLYEGLQRVAAKCAQREMEAQQFPRRMLLAEKVEN